MTTRPTIVWMRQDLRLKDNPALASAAARKGGVIPLFIFSDAEEGAWPPGGAARWWLHHSLVALDAELRTRGSRLIVMQGPALPCLQQLASATSAAAVYWNRRYEPAAVERDRRIRDGLRAEALEVASFNASLLFEPGEIRTQSGGPYRVYGAFRRRLLEKGVPPAPLAAPRLRVRPRRWPRSESIASLDLLPRIRWYAAMQAAWTPGEGGARRRLQAFLRKPLGEYAQWRDRPDLDATSRLSPHLHFGEISPRQVWHACAKAARLQGASEGQWRESVFVSELIWREFSYHVLYHYPRTPLEPMNPRYERFAWKSDQALLAAWHRGCTGFPIVDAGMRQLWATGWMHNRVRMIVASLLVKNLQISWVEGARWFWDTLVDADLAANTLNWQWVAGSGADAAPYFRIFNPIAQARKFDPDGSYIRQWVPELRALPTRHIHAPHLAPRAVLAAAQVQLGGSYPAPIVDLKESRAAALAAYRKM